MKKITKVRPSDFIKNRKQPSVKEWIGYYEWMRWERQNGIKGFSSIEDINMKLKVLYTKKSDSYPPLTKYSVAPIVAYFGSRIIQTYGGRHVENGLSVEEALLYGKEMF